MKRKTTNTKKRGKYSHLPEIDFNQLEPPPGYIPGLIRGDYGFSNGFEANQSELALLRQMFGEDDETKEVERETTNVTPTVLTLREDVDFSTLHPFELNATRIHLGMSEAEFLEALCASSNPHCVLDTNGALIALRE